MRARIASGSSLVAGIVAFALFADYLIYGLLIPLAPYTPGQVINDARLGSLYGAYSLGVLAATPLLGYFGDRTGYRRLMLCSVALSAAALALAGLAPGFVLLLVGRLFQGSASAATWTAGLALIAAYYPEKRVEAMGLALMGSTAGSLLGPVIGGALFEAGGYSLPFAMTGVLVAVEGALCWRLLPRDHIDRKASPAILALLGDRAVLTAAAAVVMAAIGWGIVEPLLPARLMRLGVSAVGIGLIFSVSSVAYGLSAPLVGWVSRRLPIRYLIAGGTGAMAIALPLLSLYRSLVPAMIGLSVVSICYAFMLNPTSAELGNAVDRRGLNCYAAVYAVYNIAYALGQVATSGFASAASAWLGYLPTLLSVSGALILFLPLLMLGGAAPAPRPAPSLTGGDTARSETA